MELDPNLNTLILSIAAFMIITMLGIIGYFVKQKDKNISQNFQDQKTTNDKLQKSIDKLALTITGLRGTIQAYGESHSGLVKRFEDFQKVCEKKFNNVKS